MNLNEMRVSAANKMRNCIFTILILILSNGATAAITDTSDIIIIDPQYGGKECGPLGSSGIMAKDVVLSIAKKVGDKIKEQTNYKVIYTRESDNYVVLQERVLTANKNNGSVFISIGVNGSNNKNVNGLEIITVNVSKNKGSTIDKSPEQDSNLEMQTIIKDLLSTTKYEKSMQLAKIIHAELTKDIDFRDRGIKSVPFYMLVGTKMPSIMIQLGFLTNVQDERLLNDQDKIAEALFQGLLKYFHNEKIKASDN